MKTPSVLARMVCVLDVILIISDFPTRTVAAADWTDGFRAGLGVEVLVGYCTSEVVDLC